MIILSIASSFGNKLPPCSGRFGDAHVMCLYYQQNVSDIICGLVSVIHFHYIK